MVRQATVDAVTRDEATGGVSAATASVAGGQEVFRASRLLVALGRRPVTEGLNLHAVGVKTGAAGEIVVDSRLASSNPGSGLQGMSPATASSSTSPRPTAPLPWRTRLPTPQLRSTTGICRG